jgi:PAS domain S-box-containing protein
MNLNAIINNLPGVAYRVKNDSSRTVAYISEGCLELTGYTTGQFINREIILLDIVLPEDRAAVVDRTNQVNISKPFYTLEYRITHKNGKLRYLKEKGQGVFNENGKLTFIEGFVQDITDQKETELQLRAEQSKNKALLEAIPDMMFIQDLQGNYVDCFSSEPQKFFMPKEAFIGKNMKDVLPPHVFEVVGAAFKRAITSGELQVAEYVVRSAAQEDFFEARFVQLNQHGVLTIVRNITAKTETDDKLVLKNKALEAASSSIVIADAKKPDTPIIYANEAFIKSTGYNRTDFIGKNCRFLQGKDRNQEGIKTMATAIKNSEACNVVVRNYKKDGAMFWNEISLTPIFNEKRELTHFIGVQNDITARKKDEFFKNAIVYVVDMIIENEPLEKIGDKIIETIEIAIPECMGSILLLNKEENTLHRLSTPNIPQAFSDSIEGISIGNQTSSCGTAAYLKKEMIVSDISISQLWKDYKKIALAAGLRSCWSFPIFSSNQEVLGTFAIYSGEVRMPRATEKDIIYDIIRAASVAIEQHNTTNALKLSAENLTASNEKLEENVVRRTSELRDVVQQLTGSNLNLEKQIQETKAAEHKVLQSKILLDNAFQNFPGGFVAVVDPTFKIVFIEGEELAALGFKGLASSSIDSLEIVPKEIRTIVKNSVKKTLKGEHCSFELEFFGRCYLVNTTPLLNEQNEIEQVLLVHNNISLQKAAELEVFNTLQKEKELSELKSRFISMASHEFRTPLSAILSSAILIEKLNDPGYENRRLDYVEKIRSNIQNLVVILNDFLSLGKLEEGKVTVQASLFDLIDFIKSILEEVEGIKKDGQQLVFQHQETTINVFLDAKLMRHVVFNLLSNAIKYSKENQVITVKVASTKQHVIFEVIDLGIGIPQEGQSNMFQRFYRAENTTNIQGTGLGLNIVKQYAELMGGNITFKSELNKGSTFCVELPLTTEKDEKNTVD